MSARGAAPARTSPRHPVWCILLLAATTIACSACQPSAPATSAAPTRAAVASPPAWVDATPDADGYYADPDGGWLEMLDAGPIGPLLVDVQAALDGGIDADRLDASLVRPRGRTAPFLVTGSVVPTIPAMTDLVPADAIAPALRRLGAAGSTPRIQGFATRPDIGRTGVVTDSMSVWIVISGWRGDSGLVTGNRPTRPRPADDTIDVWRFTRSGDEWTWVEWAMPPQGYRAVVADVLQTATPPRAERDAAGNTARYTSVRPRAWWPANNAPCEDVSTSPDGDWIVCTGERGEQRVGSRSQAGDEEGGPTYMARRLEVRSAKDDRIYGPLDDWIGDGAIGVPTWAVLGWLDGPVRLVFAEAACGEGCGFNDCGAYGARILDLTTGRITPIDLPGWRVALDAAHHRLASADAADGAVHAIDLDTGRRWTIRRGEAAKDAVIGSVGWSPDGAAVVVDQIVGDACAKDAVVSTVAFDLASGRRTVVGSRPLNPTPTPIPDTTWSPDADGYIVNPGSRDRLHHASGYLPLDAGPAGAFLVDLQARLAAHDAAWLVDAIGAGGAAEPPTAGGPALTLRALDGDKSTAVISAQAIAASLTRLIDAGSRPIVQGYFASLGEEPVAVEAQVPDDGATIDTLDVVVTGWRSDPGLFANAQATAPSGPATAPPTTAVWRFTRGLSAGDPDSTDSTHTAWRWRSWRWSHAGDYPATVAALEQILDDADKGRYTHYHAVRPRSHWPTPSAESTRDVPSPDGRWIGREVDGGDARIDVRDERSSLHFRAVRILDAAGTVVAQPLSIWQIEDMGFASPAAFAWRPGHDQVVVGWTGTGDGCDLHGGARLFLYDTASAALTPLAVGGKSSRFDPKGRFLATVGMVGPGSVDAAGNYRLERGEIEILDVDAGTTMSATTAAQEIAEPVVWSPDGSALVFTVVDDYAICAQYNASHVVRVDIRSGQLTTTALTASAPGLRRATAWRDDGTLDVDVFDAGAAWDTKAARTERRDAATGALVSP